MQLSSLYRFQVTGPIEKLGRVPDGERLKIEFRGNTAADSPISGKVHGTHWLLVGPLGAGQLEAVHEIHGAAGSRFVLQLRGSATLAGGAVVVAEGTSHGEAVEVEACRV